MKWKFFLFYSTISGSNNWFCHLSCQWKYFWPPESCFLYAYTKYVSALKAAFGKCINLLIQRLYTMTNFIRSHTHTHTHTHTHCDFLYLWNFPCVHLCSYTASISSVAMLRAFRSALSRTCPTATYGEWEETQQRVWAAVVVIRVTSWLGLNPSEKPMFASKRSSSLVIS